MNFRVKKRMSESHKKTAYKLFSKYRIAIIIIISESGIINFVMVCA